ncbi:organ-specific protein S2 [Rhodamnia argentea]|uniref:Organ-specific protein S2 n=1 Tax=Rhodamnia argentea TaxID=178133 RepID=A0A8B8NKY0_9MYRT|nr:organ-specific protein S2 [Rhodamnia argentea]
MKPNFASIFLFSLLLFAEVNDARESPGDYWRKIMKDQPMPESIRDLIHPESSSGNEKNSIGFVRDFDMRPNAIIYHGHGDAEDKQHYGENAEKGEDERLKMPHDRDQKKKKTSA